MYVFGSSKSDASDSGDLFEAELCECFTSLFLPARLDTHVCASGDGDRAVVVAGMGVVRVGVGFFDGGLVGRSVLFNFFDFRHLHTPEFSRALVRSTSSIHPSPSDIEITPEGASSDFQGLRTED